MILDFSKYETEGSKFSAQLGNKGGYVNFSNSGKGGDKKYFTLSLASFISILNDIKNNLLKFQGNENYEEKKWRDLAGTFYSDGPANAMATVQTKPLFSTLSKIIIWANEPDLNNIDPEQYIDLKDQSIQNAIDKLSNLSDTYTPENNTILSFSEEQLVYETSSIREFAFSVFKHFYGNNWGDIVTQSIKKEASINNVPFISRDFNGFTRLLGDFATIQSKDELTSGGTQRYFEEPIYEADGRYFYFTTQWMGEGDGKLSFNQLKLFFEEAFPDYRFEKDDKKFRLFKKGKESVLSFDYKSFQKKCAEAGLQFSDKMILRFVSSLCAKPFVICTGLSGSGKTKLAQSFAQWICNDEQQYKIIPVGADWTNREPLLGYPNSLDSKQYIKPESGVLDLILRAEKYAHLPHFLILDEMNLSHVERYFADFLSCMESGDYLHLHSVNEGLLDNEGNIIPGKLKLPNNLFLIGTVNVDETTYMFSPKVLDRANVIEFRVSDKDLEQYLQNPRKLDMSMLISNGADMAVDFVNIAKRNVIKEIKDEKLNKSLLLFFSELKKCGAEFGFRSAAEITRLSAILNLLEQTLKADENIDIAVMQKLLPKLHGSRNKIAKILITLAGFCVKDISDVKKEFLEKPDPIDYSTHQNVIYPLSLEKITRMYHSLVDNGYASYAEA